MVPNGWKVTKLKNIGKCVPGLTYSPSDVVDDGQGVLVLRSSNIQNGKTSFEDNVYVTVKIEPDKRVRANDILICVRNGSKSLIGKSALISDERAIGQAHGAFMTIFRSEHSQYIYQLFQTSMFDRQVQADLGATINSINSKNLLDYKFPFPPPSEQKKIAQILSTWDKSITATEQLLANSQQQKKALMQQLLTGKKRLLDKNGVRFSGEWEVSKLSKLFERVTTKNNGQSTNVVTISGQHGLIRQEDFFKKTVASETLDGYFLLKQGQFAYNKSYSNGYPMGAIKRLNRYQDGVVTTLYICFELLDSDRANSDFWEHYFESGLLNKGLSQIAHEGGRAHGLLNVKPSDFFSLKVPTPSFEEQQKIATVLSTAAQEISALQQKLNALKQEKKALMQQLLTGKRRVLVS